MKSVLQFRLRDLSLVMVLAAGAPVFADIAGTGNVTAAGVLPNQVTCFIEPNAVARVEMMAPDIVHVSITQTGVFNNQTSGAVVLPQPPFTKPLARVIDHGNYLTMVSPQITTVIYKYPFRIDMFRPDGSTLLSDVLTRPVGWDTGTGNIFGRKIANPNEYYFGFGFRGGPINRLFRTFTMTNTAVGAYSEFTDPLQLSIPFFYGLRDGKAYGVFLDNPATGYFDLGKQTPGVITFGAAAGDLNYYVMAGPSPQDVANAYGRLTGFAPLPPKWTLGFQQSRYGYKSADELLGIAQQFRDLGIPCDALYLDLDYMDHLQLFTWDPNNFPDPKGFNDQLENAGFKRVNILDPTVHTDDQLWPSVRDAGYLLNNRKSLPVIVNDFLGEVGFVDFTKTSVKNWYTAELKDFLDTGVSALWADLNEPEASMPDAVYDFGGQKRPDLAARNLYAMQEASLMYNAQKAARPNLRPWVLSRSGYAGIQRFAANWSGDTNTSFDSMRVSVQLSLSMGLSGQIQFGHDVGGFLGSPSAELYIRWLEFGSFTPFFRVHSVNTSDPREPWAFGEPYTTMARDIIRQHYRFLPYFYTLFEDSSRTGAPVLAPTFFYFPSDPNTYGQDTDFMVGASLLVAPVLQEGALQRNVLLPSGSDWIDYNTGQLYAGGQLITVDAPLERVPTFVRDGSIIPIGPNLQYAGQNAPQDMSVDVFPGASDATFVLYEDDGQSFDYQNGAYLRTELARKNQDSGMAFTIRRLHAGTALSRSWMIRFRQATAPPSTVLSGDAPLAQAASLDELAGMDQAWYFSVDDSILLVKVPDSDQLISLQVQN